MVGVIVLMAVMAIMLTVAVQTATFHKKRESELELVFRGQQFVEAVRLFRARNGRFPMKLEELVKAKPRVLRQAWKDPVTRKFDWVPVFFGQGGVQVGGGAGGVQTPGPRPAPTAAPTPTPPEDDGGGEAGDSNNPPGGKRAKPGDEAPFPPADASGPIIGVHSRSRDDAILVRDGRNRYCDWNFTLEQQQPARGGRPGQTQPTPHP